ncbi:MAG: hypothetical protein U1E77_14095 [Inhella sp.]
MLLENDSAVFWSPSFRGCWRWARYIGIREPAGPAAEQRSN